VRWLDIEEERTESERDDAEESERARVLGLRGSGVSLKELAYVLERASGPAELKGKAKEDVMQALGWSKDLKFDANEDKTLGEEGENSALKHCMEQASSWAILRST